MLTAVAHKFASSIEMLDDGILFDVSGLERLIGKPERVAQKILAEVKLSRIPASVGVADTVDAAVLLARQQTGAEQSVHLADTFEQLPLRDLDIEQDTLNVFTDLGLKRIEDLLAIPRSELVSRYGREFQNVIDTIEQRGTSLITPNVKETSVEWKFDLDQPVENFEQLIFVLNHGLEWLFAEVDRGSHSCEHLDLDLKLRNAGRKSYEIKVSFPTLERTFWLKLINLRAALDPPESEIVAIRVTAHFTKPRAAQRGLYAVSRPEPENLLLTVNKLKRLVGEENVGVPVLLDQRMAEPFTLDADAMPQGRERLEIVGKRPVVGFTYFRPPVRAEVLIRDRQLVFLKTRYFAGHILNFSGVWKGYAKWWDTPWKTLEWDVEVENDGIYRLAKAGDEWFLIGEYD
jgi:protein ImuB